MTACPWCRDPKATDETNLCRAHEAESMGLSVSEMDRMDREQTAEWLDTMS